MPKEFELEIQKLKNDYPEFFEQFSPEFLDFIFSEETLAKIAEICLENGIEDEEKIEKIAYRVTLALFNQVPKENLAEILEKEVNLSQETAEKIFIEIKRRIFSQAPEMLKRKPVQPSKPSPPVEPELGPPPEVKPEIKPKRDIYREPIE